ncbi:hypothetical protein Tsubulata_019832 [Turnera subulata]|uniref:TPX2 C-terminal domain-containing protein n=1 Tax=Turnera subulata TaxID=218843 RepID=A0A9Q0J613_9ROSI|nr:hypothetical protein Tsubulata_019832 [Turnera subulata]
MGESIVAASYNGDKIKETAASVPALNVSVSFGRFENDSLSWERWSSFSPNKYLEEVEKCATPGSVAQKKAYFEAHYKKIAAQKAELMDQEKQEEHVLSPSNHQYNGDLSTDTRKEEEEFRCDLYSGQDTAEEAALEAKLDSEVGNDYNVDEPDEDAAVHNEGQVSLVGEVKDELGSKLESLTLNEPDEDAVPVTEEEMSNHVSEEVDSRLGGSMLIKPEESAVVKEEETPLRVSRDKMDMPKKVKKEMGRMPVKERENVKLEQRKEPAKKTLMSKVRDIARAKKPVSPVTKAPQMSTPKVSRPVPTSTSLSASRSSTKKVTGSLLPSSRKPPAEESKKVAPKSLHMSLNLEAPSSVVAPPSPLTATRKSFIMEKMGDKDIVKRAFKTFQNNYNQLKASAEERSLRAKQQVPTKAAEVKVSTSTTTPRKENGGSLKLGSVDRKTAKPAPSSLLKSDEKAEKKKEFPKKLGEKSSAKEAESRSLRTKSKEEKGAEIKNQRQSLNFKATPMSGFYRGQKVSRSPLDKVLSLITLSTYVNRRITF